MMVIGKKNQAKETIRKKQKVWKKTTSMAFLMVFIVLCLAGCFGNSRKFTKELTALIQEKTKETSHIPSLSDFLGKGKNSKSGGKRTNHAEVLEGYDELVSAVEIMITKQTDKEGSVTAEQAEQLAADIYAYGCELKENKKISECIQDKAAKSVTMVLSTGARILFAPHIKDTYSGNYSVSTINAVDFSETVPVAVVFNGTKSVKDYGEYTLEMIEDCTDWSHLNDKDVNVDGVRTLLENIAQNHCRLIYWRGHGNISDGQSVFMLAEEVNDATSEAYEEDIRNGILIAGSETYWITPGFVEKYMSETNEGGLFFCGSCYSAADNGQMARAFLEKGFQAYAGTSNEVLNIYSDRFMKYVAENLCEEDLSSPGNTMSIHSALLNAKESMKLIKREHQANTFAAKGQAEVIDTTFLLYERIKEPEPSRYAYLETNTVTRTDNRSYLDLQAIEQSRTVPAFRLKTSRIQNNGTSIVRWNGNDYYWKYNADSVENDGLFAYYPFREGTINQMICRHPDEQEEVLFELDWSGDIYLVGNRIYLEKSGGMCSVNMDGSGLVDYHYFHIWDVDEQAGTVLGMNEGKIQLIHSETGEIETIAAGDYHYAGTADGYAYYTGSTTEELTLYQYKPDGSQGVREVQHFAYPPEYRSYGELIDMTYITQLTSLNHTLYYSYGFYAGTGGFFQQGGINYLELSEQGDPLQGGICIERIQAEEFLVEDGSEGINIYYIEDTTGSYIGFWEDTPYPGCSVKNMTTGQVSPSDFRLTRPGAFVYLDNAIYREMEHQADYTPIISEEMTTAYGCTGGDLSIAPSITLIHSIEQIDQDIYYTVERCTRDTARDMGWRPGYIRTGSERYRLTLGETQAKLLFSY